MVFIDRNGQEIVTITELFETKKFISARDNYFIFFNLYTNQEEMWTFTDNLFMHIPFPMEIDRIKEICESCGWCKKVEE